MAKYSADTVPECLPCTAAGIESKVCRKCAVAYCRHFASITDNRYCGNCISDFSLKETIMEKTVEHERPDGTVTFSRKYQARHIKLEGTDWLFAAALIPDMMDSEIEATIEYHRANIGLMLQERESRKLERYKKLANVIVKHEPRKSQHELEKKASRKSKIRVSEKDVTPDKLLAMLQGLAKAGITAEQIQTMLAGK